MGKLLSSTELENEYITRALRGDYSFVDAIDAYDINVIFNDLERMSNKEQVIDAMFSALQKKFPIFAFYLVSKIEKYKNFTLDFLSRKENLTPGVLTHMEKLISYCSWFYSYVRSHLELLPSYGERIICLLLQRAYEIRDRVTIKSLVESPDITIRSSCLSYVFESSLRSELNTIYPGNLTDYFVIKDKEGNVIDKIPEEELSRCATFLFDYQFNEKLYMQIMQFILENYPDNHLLSYLLEEYSDDNLDHRKEFLEKNIFLLYDSSCDAQLDIYNDFKHLLDERRIYVLERFLQMVEPDQWEFIYGVFRRGLGNKILTYFHEYLRLSISQECKYVTGGSFSIVYRVGDWFLKISNGKSSYEDPLCPRSYLIVKNYDEYFIRSSNLEIIVAGIEVQKKAYRPLTKKDYEIENRFIAALAEEGYVSGDALARDAYSNLWLLHDYHDADTDDPESLPEWFKKTPAVLVDHDLVFPIDKPISLRKINKIENKGLK